jgi:uncharacterized repeat protein (TIGR04076 family)
MAKVKITVLKKMSNPELARDYCVRGEAEHICPLLEEGKEFIADGRQPEGFCTWAWDDIGKYLTVFQAGGNFTDTMKWMKDRNTVIACCTDGIRPVVFRIERM